MTSRPRQPTELQHKVHKSDELPYYNKDGSTSILARLNMERQETQKEVGKEVSRSLESLSLTPSASGQPQTKSETTLHSANQQTNDDDQQETVREMVDTTTEHSTPALTQEPGYHAEATSQQVSTDNSIQWQGDSISIQNGEKKSSGVAAVAVDHEAIASRATQMVEMLSEENFALRQELEGYYQKVSKLQKFEEEIKRVQSAHQMLVKSSGKREQLEKMVRAKLENEIRKLQEVIRELKLQLELFKSGAGVGATKGGDIPATIGDGELRMELAKRDTIITQLVTQNKDQLTNKDRLEIELAAQNETLAEQRQHIDVLDTALSNAQSNVVKLQEECRKKQMYADKVEELQRTLVSLQTVYEKREQMEKKMRNKLERELEAVRSQQHVNTDEGQLGLDDQVAVMEILKEREERILTLETENTKWEQKYLEEAALRQSVLDTAPAATNFLNDSMLEAQKISLAEMQRDKSRSAEELLLSQRRYMEMESRVATLNSQLAEKDQIVKLVQQQSADKEMAYRSLERLLLPSASPHGSHQNLALTPAKGPLRESGSQERLGLSPAGPSGLGYASSSYTSLNSSAPMLAGIFGSDTDLQRERNKADERLRELDQEIAKQDFLLDSLQTSKDGSLHF